MKELDLSVQLRKIELQLYDSQSDHGGEPNLFGTATSIIRQKQYSPWAAGIN